ncbi:hypothetical protein B0H13DRAFT_2314150 [Mycena leptocephala]|nr:hypothetical protein B0H13DRAFT_2314150 [Mycena leptocephala]
MSCDHHLIFTQFIREHGDGRSALLGVIRKALPVILTGYGIDSGLLTNAKADRSKDKAINRLLRFPTERKATLYPPILFPGPTQNMNEQTGAKLQRHKTRFPQRYRVFSLSGSDIVLSTDAEWAAKGAISGIEWEEEYCAYHKMLACNRHLPHVKAIFKRIHKFVFAGTTSSPATASNSTADEDDEMEEAISDALRRFELGMDPVSDPDGGDLGNGTGPAAQPDGSDLGDATGPAAQPDGGNLGNGTGPAAQPDPRAPGEPPEEPTREDRAEAEEVLVPAKRSTRRKAKQGGR